ncbi:MAG: Asd/ArgC dimerization domain-containing protein [Candidatus Binatia bacterium]
MNGRGWVLAVVGAASQIGREVQAAALERGLPVREWRLYDTTEEGADLVREDLPAPLLPGEPVDLDGVDVVFLCGPAAASAAAVERSRAARAIVIDVIQSLAEDEAAFIVPEVNGDTIAEALDRAVFACPLPGATALSVVLHPLHAVAELRRVVVTALEPVSHAGPQAIEQLARETRELLTGTSPGPGILPYRVAFNLSPQVGDVGPDGWTTHELGIESQLRRVLDLPDLRLSVTAVCVPTFYGQAYTVSIKMARPLSANDAAQLLRRAPGVLLVETDSLPTVADASGSEATQVARLREDPSSAHALSMWVVIDGLRTGGAVNAVQIAERVLHERG